jgi:hypothetical protein
MSKRHPRQIGTGPYEHLVGTPLSANEHEPA